MYQKIRIELTSYDCNLIDESVKKITKIAKSENAIINESTPLPPCFKRSLSICHFTPKTIDLLTKLNLPSEVKVEVEVPTNTV